MSRALFPCFAEQGERSAANLVWEGGRTFVVIDPPQGEGSYRSTLAALAAGILIATPVVAQEETESWLPSLITETPEQGFDLAIVMARKAVTTTQTDRDTLHALRPAYAHDPDSLIDVSGVVAGYFTTIAEANDFWRE